MASASTWRLWAAAPAADAASTARTAIAARNIALPASGGLPEEHSGEGARLQLGGGGALGPPLASRGGPLAPPSPRSLRGSLSRLPPALASSRRAGPRPSGLLRAPAASPAGGRGLAPAQPGGGGAQDLLDRLGEQAVAKRRYERGGAPRVPEILRPLRPSERDDRDRGEIAIAPGGTDRLLPGGPIRVHHEHVGREPGARRPRRESRRHLLDGVSRRRELPGGPLARGTLLGDDERLPPLRSCAGQLAGDRHPVAEHERGEILARDAAVPPGRPVRLQATALDPVDHRRERHPEEPGRLEGRVEALHPSESSLCPAPGAPGTAHPGRKW